MFVYIWKTPEGVPFYVGATNSIRRTNPANSHKRNWLCTHKLEEIGREHVVVEIKFVNSVSESQALECKLIAEFGRIQTSNGTLTNLTSGGEGVAPMPAKNREKMRESMRDPNHPIRSPEAVIKRNAAQKKRMNSPDIKARFTGENNPAKKPEVREKLKAIWQDSDFREQQSKARTGVPKNFSEEDLAKRAQAVRDNPEMKHWGERNGKDPEFDAKRIEGIRAAQPKRAEKMRDPVALAQRKERLKATLNSPEYKAKRALLDTPEYRAKLSEAKRAYWASKRLIGTAPSHA